jgi:Tfp pilus assembly major pilin PilA
MLILKHNKAQLKYVATVFFKTGLVTAAWFGLTGVVLNAVSDRVSLQCERNEESVPECKLSVERLFTQTTINTTDVEFHQLTNQAISTAYLPSLAQWQMTIATSHGKIEFTSIGMANTDRWQDFTDRTNRFLTNPQLRTLAITSEYSFWFKVLSQSVSGISLICGLFIIPGLYLTAKYADNAIEQQQALEGFFGKFIGARSPTVSSEPIPEKIHQQ